MKARLITVGVLTILGMPSYFACVVWHLCMAGHMQHPPYPIGQWVSDSWWISCFACVFVFSLRLHAKGKVWLFYGSLFLIISRIPLGSLGGCNPLELPVIVMMLVVSIRSLLNPKKYLQVGEQRVGQASSDGVPPEEPST